MKLEDVAAKLATEDRAQDRMMPALRAAMAVVRERTAAKADVAEDDLLFALSEKGADCLAGGDPQELEDALYQAKPDSPLAEETLRFAWLALVDDLARSGGKPPFGGSGAAETWAFTARSRHWPFVDMAGQVRQVVSLFGEGLKVVVVRGPGTSSFLAAVRRALLGAHPDAIIPPVVSAACDSVGGVLKPYVKRGELPDELKNALDRLGYGEDMVGLLGRIGDKQPIAFIVDDAHLEARSMLLGSALFLEPAPERKALLVLGGPDDAAQDGSMGEILEDARGRGCLTEIRLPAFTPEFAGALLLARFGEVPKGLAAALYDAVDHVGERTEVERLRIAQAWLSDIATGDEVKADAAEILAAGYDVNARLPEHQGAVRVLSIAALEGERFHALAVGKLLGEDEDYVEDLLHDDEFELDGRLVGTCDKAIPPARTVWAKMADDVHPAYDFADPRISSDLRRRLTDEERKNHANGLMNQLLEGYQMEGFWQVAPSLYALSQIADRKIEIPQRLLASNDPPRIEAGFRRLLPVLMSKAPFRLALSRLFGASMEIGALASAMGKIPLADQAFQAAAASADRLGRPGAAGEALARLGEIRLALALPEPAQQALMLSGQLLEKAGHIQSALRVMLLLAEVDVLQGDLDAAIKRLRETLKALRESGDHGHTALGQVRLGRILYERGDYETAILSLDDAMREAEQSHDPRPVSAACMARAFVHAEKGELQPAFQLLQKAAVAFQAAHMPPHILEVSAAGLQRRDGNPAASLDRLKPIEEAYKKAGATVQWAEVQQEMGRCYLGMKQYTDAVNVLNESLKVRKQAHDRFALIRLYEDLGDAQLGQGDRPGAAGSIARALNIAERLKLQGHMDRLNKKMSEMIIALDGTNTDVPALKEAAVADIDALEALWKAPPQPPQAPEEQKIQ